VSPEGLTVLLGKQRDWLRSRNDCVAKDKSRDETLRCITDAYSARTDELNAQYRASGSLAIEQRVAARRIPRWRVDEAQSYPWLVGTPPARAEAFNRYIAERLQPAKGLFATSGIKLDSKPDGDTTFSRYYEIHRLDDRLISIEFFQYHQSYIGHAWRSEFAINWDLRRNRVVRVHDIFHPDRDWQQAVYDYAMHQLQEAGEISNPESWFTQAEVDDDDAWLFNDEEAMLMLGHGERSLAGASAEVTIPYDFLRPFLRADAPI